MDKFHFFTDNWNVAKQKTTIYVQTIDDQGRIVPVTSEDLSNFRYETNSAATDAAMQPWQQLSTHSLTITKEPENGGNVYGYNPTDFKSNPVDCGKQSTCTATFSGGTQVALDAIPNGKFRFAYWDDGIACILANPLNVLMSGN